MPQIKKISPSKETNIVSSIMYRYLPYWPLFILLFIIGIASAVLYLRYAKPKYQISATILIKDEKKGVDESNILQDLNIYTSKKIVENEIEVIHSRKLMRDVVNQLHLYAPVFEKGWLNEKSAYSKSPIIIQAKKPEYIQSLDSLIPFSIKNNEVIINNKSYPLQTWLSTPYGEFRFDVNGKKSQQALNPLFFNLSNPKDVVTDLLQNMNVAAASKLSTVANLTLIDEDPQRGEDVLNKLIEIYNQASINEKNAVQANTLAFVELRLQEVERDLNTLEERIQQFRSNRGAVNLSEQSKLFLRNVGDNDQKLSDLNMQIAVLDQVEFYVKSKDNKSAIVPAALGINNPGLTQLMQRLYNAQLEYETLRETTGDKNPMVITVGKEIEAIRPNLLEKIQNERNVLHAGINNLKTSSITYDGILRSIPEKERELTEISRDQTIKNSVYSFLLQKREQTALAISSTTADSRIIDVAEASAEPVSPRKAFVYIAAFILPLCLGIGGVYGKELLNKKILFRSEIDSFTVVPVLAEVSRIKEKESISQKSSKVSLAADQFRQLRAAMGLRSTQPLRNKKILITSMIPGEGKTYISINLAISLALTGKKVVLIDLDFYNPKSSNLLGAANVPGVAEFLEGKETAEQIINKTNYNNLFVVGSGQEENNTQDLILNGNLKELFEYLETFYDYLIIDTCPIDMVTDAYVLGEYCDCSLLVVRHSYTPKTILKAIDSNKKIKALKNVSIVFNDVRSRGIFRGKYGYGYGFGYENVYSNKTINGAKVMRTTKKLMEA